MEAQIFRLLDANTNRAREALRVLEDAARFVLNDATLSERLKNLRHELASISQLWEQPGLVHRDVTADVGRTISTPAEAQRADLQHVVTAAAKRLAEALRSLEEYAKVIAPSAFARIESLR